MSNKIVYELATSVKTEITDETLKEQYKTMQNSITTYEGTTYIDVSEYGEIAGTYYKTCNT